MRTIAGVDHRAHQLVLCNFAPALQLAGRNIAVLNRLFDQFKRHWNRSSVAVVERIEKVDAAHISAADVVKMPAHQLVLIGPRLLLNRVVEDQHTVVAFDRTNHWFDLPPQVSGGEVLTR